MHPIKVQGLGLQRANHLAIASLLDVCADGGGPHSFAAQDLMVGHDFEYIDDFRETRNILAEYFFHGIVEI